MAEIPDTNIDYDEIERCVAARFASKPDTVAVITAPERQVDDLKKLTEQSGPEPLVGDLGRPPPERLSQLDELDTAAPTPAAPLCDWTDDDVYDMSDYEYKPSRPSIDPGDDVIEYCTTINENVAALQACVDELVDDNANLFRWLRGINKKIDALDAKMNLLMSTNPILAAMQPRRQETQVSSPGAQVSSPGAQVVVPNRLNLFSTSNCNSDTR